MKSVEFLTDFERSRGINMDRLGWDRSHRKTNYNGGIGKIDNFKYVEGRDPPPTLLLLMLRTTETSVRQMMMMRTCHCYKDANV
jgi:hypothetical protein